MNDFDDPYIGMNIGMNMEDEMPSWKTTDWKGDTARGARMLSERQARFKDKQHKKTYIQKAAAEAAQRVRDRKQRRERMPKSAQERAARLEKELGSGKFWKAPVGPFVVRVLPTPANKKGEDDLFLEYFVHEKVGKDKRFLRCGKDSSGKGKCYICDKVIPKLRKAGKDSRAAGLEPIPKVAVQIAVVQKDGSMEGPEMWLPNKLVQAGLVAKVFNNTKKNPTDPKKGRNLNYKRVGSGMKDTKYFGPDLDDDATPVPKDILKKLKPFEEVKKAGNLVLYKYSEEDQKKAYLGEGDSSSSESESESSASSSESESISLSSEEESKPKKGKKGKKPSSSEESSEEESSEEDSSEESSEEDSSEESEKPKKGKKKSKKDESSEEESEEDSSEEESEEDSEESEKPKKGKSKKGKKKASESEEESSEEESSEEESS